MTTTTTMMLMLLLMMSGLVIMNNPVAGLVAPVIASHQQNHEFNDNNNNNNNDDDNDAQQMKWQELARILINMNEAGVPDDILMRTRLSIPNLNRVYIASSNIPNAGRGLFAKIDCKEGELLSCYPGDILLQESGMTGLPDELEQNEDKLRSLLKKYSIGITEEYAIMALPDLDHDMAYASHFINDGANPPVIESEFDRYLEESRRCANAYHIPLENLHMATIAKRDIKKDEEIFACYGPVYWMGHSETWRGDDLVLP